jgi:exodeoxyribonuclease VII small subunit
MAKEKFEDAFRKLEEIVRQLEAGDITLEEALKSFEEGVRLIRVCSAKLEEAQRRVEILLGTEEGLEVKRFEGNDGD